MDVIEEASPSSEGSSSSASDTTIITRNLPASGQQSFPNSCLPDLFPRTRRRVSAAAFTRSYVSHQFLPLPDKLRRELLSAEFGWDQDIEALIKDELDHLYHMSPCAVFLSKWLHLKQSVDNIEMVRKPYSTSHLDWMTFALDLLNQGASRNEVADRLVQRLVQRLIHNHELHAAVTILLGLGDHEGALKIYASRGCNMEALLLTCLFFPDHWHWQRTLVGRWDAGKLETPGLCTWSRLETDGDNLRPRESTSTPCHLAQPQQRSEPLGQRHGPDDSYPDSTIGDLSNFERHVHRPSDVSRSAAHCSEQQSGHQPLPPSLLTHVAFQPNGPPSRLSDFERPPGSLADRFSAPPPTKTPDPSGIVEGGPVVKPRMRRRIVDFISTVRNV